MTLIQEKKVFNTTDFIRIDISRKGLQNSFINMFKELNYIREINLI
jgi:hypothetical protein